MPKISVIIPCYGVEKYLDRCIESVINQTLREIEIILVDDGSPDQVPQMCDEYAKKDSRIKVIHKQNAGLGYARNSGLEIATGDYVAFVDSDDYIDLSMYSVLYDEAIASNADVVFCGFKTEIRIGTWKDSNEVKERTEWDSNAVNDFMLDMVACAPHVREERKYQMSVWHSIYRNEIIQSHQICFHSEREVVSEDLPFQIDFLKQTNKIVYLPDSYYYYCLNGTSLSQTIKIDKFYKFKVLRTILLQSLNDIDKASLRVNRQFIGYCRSFMLSLSNSLLPDKKRIFCDILSDEIWNEVSLTYKPSYLKLYHKVFYILCLHRQVCLLMAYCQLIRATRRHLGKRALSK